MYLDLSITSDENAMLSGSDGQNYQSGGGAFVGQGGAPIVSLVPSSSFSRVGRRARFAPIV